MERKDIEGTQGASKDIAGKGKLDDEMLPDEGRPVGQPSTGGEQIDTAGEHGRMAPETAKGLEEPREE